MNLNTSEFDGGLFELIVLSIIGYFITAITFGICFPWALCLVYGWKINHTTIEGRRLKFNGTAVSLFTQWIKWLLLTIITLGIYGFWVGIKLEQWKAKQTKYYNNAIKTWTKRDVEKRNKAKEENPDLIILDVMMPKMNGFKICRLLKFDAKYKDIPILMLTARSQDKDKELGEETGADEYITKPFDIDFVLERVKEYLENGKASR